ncbi:hypothetical protein TNCV_2264521 [Trichonephila clavipes]|nr:hypothetical protein TNCV_2264521 [Trichonephila clavipes]
MNFHIKSKIAEMLDRNYSYPLVQQPMRDRAYCVLYSSIRDHWALRCMSRCPDQVVSLKRDSHCLSPQARLVIIDHYSRDERPSRLCPAQE